MNRRYSKYIYQYGLNGPTVDAQITLDPSTFQSTVSGVPESIRISQRQCPIYVTVGDSTNPCWNSTPGSRVIATTDAPVQTGTMSESQRLALLQAQTLFESNDPNNPDTRFEQYNRPQPPPPTWLRCGPERLPNKDGGARQAGCYTRTKCARTNQFGPSVLVSTLTG